MMSVVYRATTNYIAVVDVHSNYGNEYMYMKPYNCLRPEDSFPVGGVNS